MSYTASHLTESECDIITEEFVQPSKAARDYMELLVEVLGPADTIEVRQRSERTCNGQEPTGGSLVMRVRQEAPAAAPTGEHKTPVALVRVGPHEGWPKVPRRFPRYVGKFSCYDGGTWLVFAPAPSLSAPEPRCASSSACPQCRSGASGGPPERRTAPAQTPSRPAGAAALEARGPAPAVSSHSRKDAEGSSRCQKSQRDQASEEF